METALEIIARIGTDNPPTLSELSSARSTLARELHAQRGAGTTDLQALLSLREAYNVADAAVAEAEAAEAAAAAEVDEILADVPNPDAEADEAEADEEDEADDEVEDADDAPAVASAQLLSVREAIQRLGITERAAAPESESSGPVNDLSTTSHEVFVHGAPTSGVTLRGLAETFSANTSQKVGKEVIARVETSFAAERTLPGNKAGNTQLIDSILSPEAVAAAGGCCSLPQPIYDNPVNSSTARPIRDSLPTLGVQGRGRVDFFPAICLPVDGVGVWTCEDDEALDPNDPETWKDCAAQECDEAESAEVVGIYRCRTVGRFQSRYAPEQWEGTLAATLAEQARTAEARLFSEMRANVSSTHTGASTGSTLVNVLQTVSLAAATIRQQQRQLRDVRFQWTVGDWIRDAIFSDLVARKVRGADSLEVADQLLLAGLGNLGVDPVFSPDIDTIEITGAQYDGALTDFPDVAHSVLAPVGFFSFLDGGQFDLGTEITDHALNRQNTIAAFAEGFEGLMARGCNAKGLDIPVEVCAAVPCESGE